MEINYYFFKEFTREYEKEELIEFLNGFEFITIFDEARNKLIYNNELLNFEASFNMLDKSIVNNIHNLDPRYLDTNLVLKFNLLTSTYKLQKLLVIVEQMCKKFNFLVFNEMFVDVSTFKKNMIINSFDLIKKAYKNNHINALSDYYFVDKLTIDVIYSYLENKEYFNSLSKSNDLEALNYVFYKKANSKKAYVGLLWDMKKAFIFPTNIDLFVLDDGTSKTIISFKEFYSKINKFASLLNVDMYGVYKLDPRYLKKVKKILQKTAFTKLKVNLEEISLDNILDMGE